MAENATEPMGKLEPSQVLDDRIKGTVNDLVKALRLGGWSRNSTQLIEAFNAAENKLAAQRGSNTLVETIYAVLKRREDIGQLLVPSVKDPNDSIKVAALLHMVLEGVLHQL